MTTLFFEKSFRERFSFILSILFILLICTCKYMMPTRGRYGSMLIHYDILNWYHHTANTQFGNFKLLNMLSACSVSCCLFTSCSLGIVGLIIQFAVGRFKGPDPCSFRAVAASTPFSAGRGTGALDSLVGIWPGTLNLLVNVFLHVGQVSRVWPAVHSSPVPQPWVWHICDFTDSWVASLDRFVTVEDEVEAEEGDTLR